MPHMLGIKYDESNLVLSSLVFFFFMKHFLHHLTFTDYMALLNLTSQIQYHKSNEPCLRIIIETGIFQCMDSSPNYFFSNRLLVY